MPGLASLTKSLQSRIGERKSQVCLLELDDQDKPAGDYMAFQYFPETISDTKEIDYQQKAIPGGSLPLYQWTSSGARVISFEAIFTADVDLNSSSSAYATLKTKGHISRNVDIRTALVWLRKYTLPSYQSNKGIGVPLTVAPRKCILFITNSGIGLTGGKYDGLDIYGTDQASQTDAGQNAIAHSVVQAAIGGNSTNAATFETTRALDSPFYAAQGSARNASSIPVIMTKCDINYEAFFPSGLPRIATVGLEFHQIAQLQGKVNFPSSSDMDDLMNNGSESKGIAPYPIRFKFQ